MKAYERPSDDLSLFGEKLAAITYFFFNDHLFLIRLRFAAPADGLAIMSGFEAAFGCKSTPTDTSIARHLELYVPGRHAEMFAQYVIGNTREVGLTGQVDFSTIGVAAVIDQEVKREATSQF